MPTSSDVRDYCRELPTTPPDYLREWAEEREWGKNAILFKQGWIKDPITGLREKAADCVCTACGSRFSAGWISPGACAMSLNSGIMVGTVRTADYETTVCPDCGARVRVRHLSGDKDYEEEYAWPLTLHRIPEPGKKDRLAMVCWSVEKSFDQLGRRHISIRAWEAFVAEEKKIIRCSRHGGMFYAIWWHDWEQRATFSETLGAIWETVCPEGIATATEGTTAENAKLELYLKNGETAFPVAWLRLWQMRPQAETLLTCGAEGIAANLVGDEKLRGHGFRREYNTKVARLRCLNWRARRPWEILRMRGRDELREAIRLQERENLGGQTWRLWMEARAEGRPWTLEDASALEQLKCPESTLARLLCRGQRPAKILRYLRTQGRRWQEDKTDELMLADYWDMAGDMLDLSDPEVCWPERLRREHDRLIEARKAEKNRAQDEKIATVAERLERYCWHREGILIRPARSTAELEAEGKALHHCVGSYAPQVAAGRTYIFFIRREEEPDTPWYTLNMDKEMREVVQNRGSRNCDRTPEIEAFEAAWLAWVRAGAKKREEAAA